MLGLSQTGYLSQSFNVHNNAHYQKLTSMGVRGRAIYLIQLVPRQFIKQGPHHPAPTNPSLVLTQLTDLIRSCLLSRHHLHHPNCPTFAHLFNIFIPAINATHSNAVYLLSPLTSDVLECTDDFTAHQLAHFIYDYIRTCLNRANWFSS